MKLTSKKEILATIYNEEVTELQKKIEGFLSEGDYTTHTKYIEMIVTGEYKDKTKEIVGDNYCLEGWSSVTIKGSSNSGERGGLSSVKLFF